MIKIKREDPDAILPTRANDGDAGYDVYVPKTVIIYPGKDKKVPLGWRCSFPSDYAMVFFNKSGRATKNKLMVGAEIVDSGYRGIVHAHLFNLGKEHVLIKKGEKITQFLMLKINTQDIEEVDKLDETDRGDGGFGSSGLDED